MTLDAFRDHGRPRASLQEGVDGASDRLGAFATQGIDLDAVTEKLQADGAMLKEEVGEEDVAEAELGGGPPRAHVTHGVRLSRRVRSSDPRGAERSRS